MYIVSEIMQAKGGSGFWEQAGRHPMGLGVNRLLL